MGKIKLLPEEKKGLEEVLKLAEKKGFELYLFGSRLFGRGADIDIFVKSKNGDEINLKDILELSVKFHLFSDTKIDLVPLNKENLDFYNFVKKDIESKKF